MPLESGPDMLVVLDGHPNSSACLAVARRYALRPLTLAGWETDPSEVGDLHQSSGAADPTVSEAVRVASQNKVPWIAMRRDIAPPEQLLTDLLVSAAHHRDAELPGFGVLLADGEPRPFDRILAIVDRRGGPISGLLAYIGVVVTHRANAQLDILVIGAEDEDLPADAGADTLLAINRERELYDRARQLARELDLSPTFITASAAEDPWTVIDNLLAQGAYDLVIDDLGPISLGRGRVKRSVEGALSAGEVGEIPLRLLSDVSVPLLLVIDEIRLGMVPATLIKAGAAAAITLGMASSSVLPGAAPAAASQVARPDDAAPLLDHLQGGIDSASLTQRASDARASSRSTAITVQTARDTGKGSVTQATDKAKKVSTPKGGADPKDVAKARRAAAKSKADLKAAKQAKAKAQQSLSKAEEALSAAEQTAQETKAAIQTAQAAHHATADAAQRASSESSGIRSLLPGGATDLDAAVAQADADKAHEEYLSAVAAGGEALTELTEAQLRVEDRQFELVLAQDAAQEAKVGYSADQAKFEVYKESLAATRQSPVAKGNYRLTARFGQSGGYWSSGIHTGLDFAGKSGTDVTAAATGTVVSAGYEGAYGNRVVLDHGNGYQSTYNHLSAIKVSVGDRVTTGDLIGRLGGTGNVTGPHLHFEVTHNETFVDPEAWLGW